MKWVLLGFHVCSLPDSPCWTLDVSQTDPRWYCSWCWSWSDENSQSYPRTYLHNRKRWRLNSMENGKFIVELFSSELPCMSMSVRCKKQKATHTCWGWHWYCTRILFCSQWWISCQTNQNIGALAQPVHHQLWVRIVESIVLKITREKSKYIKKEVFEILQWRICDVLMVLRGRSSVQGSRIIDFHLLIKYKLFCMIWLFVLSFAFSALSPRLEAGI